MNEGQNKTVDNITPFRLSDYKTPLLKSSNSIEAKYKIRRLILLTMHFKRLIYTMYKYCLKRLNYEEKILLYAGCAMKLEIYNLWLLYKMLECNTPSGD